METKITLNLSESEYKALTVVCKALRTTPEAVVRASAKKLFENPMDFLFDAFANEAMGFQATEGKPSVNVKEPAKETVKVPAKPAPVKTQTVKTQPVKKTEAPKPIPIPVIRDKYTAKILAYLEAHPYSMVKDIIFGVVGQEEFEYKPTDINFRYILREMSQMGDKKVICDTSNGNTRWAVRTEGGATPAKQLTAEIILSPSGKYRKQFYAVLAEGALRPVKEEDFYPIFEKEDFESGSIPSAVKGAIDELAKKRLIIPAGKKGEKIIILEKFREKVYKTYPELKARFA